MKKWLILLPIILITGCVHRNTITEYSTAPELLKRAEDFYTFMLRREFAIKHNDQEQQFRSFFLDTGSYYDFMDSYLFILRDRNINRYTINHFYISGVETSEDGTKATIKIKFLSRDAYLLYRKINATQHWEKTYDKWYPKKIVAPALNKYTKFMKLYALPPVD